jgi:hypothetical protein
MDDLSLKLESFPLDDLDQVTDKLPLWFKYYERLDSSVTHELRTSTPNKSGVPLCWPAPRTILMSSFVDGSAKIDVSLRSTGPVSSVGRVVGIK